MKGLRTTDGWDGKLGTNRPYLEEFDAHLLSVRGLLGGNAAEQGQDPHQLSLPEQGQERVILKVLSVKMDQAKWSHL
jgi:hypothetical protein